MVRISDEAIQRLDAALYQIAEENGLDESQADTFREEVVTFVEEHEA